MQIHGDELVQTLGSSVGDSAEHSQNFFEAWSGLQCRKYQMSTKLALTIELRFRYH